MVARREIHVLLSLIANLMEIRSHCLMPPVKLPRVKGPNGILEMINNLSRIMPFLIDMFKNSKFEETQNKARSEMNEWASYLTNSYVEQSTPFGKPVKIMQKDARKLAQSCHNWVETIMRSFKEDGTVLINSENLKEVFSNETMQQLDFLTWHDLNEGIDSIFNFLPTASAMILLRAGENLVRQYYTRLTGKEGKSWNKMIKDLTDMKKGNEKFLGYLSYLGDKRNETQHPDKIYTQQEAERILLNLKDIMTEIMKDK